MVFSHHLFLLLPRLFLQTLIYHSPCHCLKHNELCQLYPQITRKEKTGSMHSCLCTHIQSHGTQNTELTNATNLSFDINMHRCIQTPMHALSLSFWCPSTSLRTSFVLFVGCSSSQQHASVSQGRICTDNFTCYHTEIEAADQTFHLTQSQYTDTGPTSPSADPITPGAWQSSHWSANF